MTRQPQRPPLSLPGHTARALLFLQGGFSVVAGVIGLPAAFANTGGPLGASGAPNGFDAGVELVSFALGGGAAFGYLFGTLVAGLVLLVVGGLLIWSGAALRRIGPGLSVTLITFEVVLLPGTLLMLNNISLGNLGGTFDDSALRAPFQGNLALISSLIVCLVLVPVLRSRANRHD